jgi:5'-nucleotidase
MNILVSNDDGYLATGINCLVRKLQQFAQVTVVAPDRNRSGASNSLTLDHPLHLQVAENGFIYIDGTPTDCVHLALTGLLDILPDIVVSGINAGGNLGDDVLYSGTVAAAMEGRFLGLPAIAISLVGNPPSHYDTAAHIAEFFLKRIKTHALDLPPNTILNVNVPNCAIGEIKGIRITRLGCRHFAKAMVKSVNPRGKEIYWIGEAGEAQDASEGTDFHAVLNNFVSITPLHVDLTRYSAIETIEDWITT